tara:strand:+ start:337 stop:708 length:372 start_codon:yes stop_codon:yes gene_type:complete
MANSRSPFEDLFIDVALNIRNDFKRHDKYLNFALLLAFVPLPFIGFISLIISLVGFYLNIKNKFAIDEKSRLVSIFVLSIVNITLTLMFTFSIYSLFFNSLYEIIFDIKLFFNDLLNTRNTFI